jgi:hypothetical protein
VCLFEDDDGTVRLKGLLDLLRVLLGYALFEHLWHRFDKLLRLYPNETKTPRLKKRGHTTPYQGEQRRTSMRVRFGTIALTSLMTLGLEPASNDSSFTLKIVFSFGLAAAAASSPAAASSAPAPPAAAPAGAAAPAAGKAISWMFRRDCVVGIIFILFCGTCVSVCGGGFVALP